MFNTRVNERYHGELRDRSIMPPCAAPLVDGLNALFNQPMMPLNQYGARRYMLHGAMIRYVSRARVLSDAMRESSRHHHDAMLRRVTFVDRSVVSHGA